MTVEQIKSEFEKLSQMLASWQQGEEIATIERDLALDKLKKIYDALRFEPKLESTTIPIPAIDLSAVDQKAEPNNEQQNEEEEEENQVEVEFLFAEEDEEEESESHQTEENDAVKQEVKAESEAHTPEVVEIAPAVTVETAEPTPQPQTLSHEPVHVHVHLHTPATVGAAAPDVAPAPQPQAVNQIVEEKTHEISVESKQESKQEPTNAQASSSTPTLFAPEEVARKPRSKHQRMMSIYNEQPSKAEEKVVDISKIFDLDMGSSLGKSEPQRISPKSHTPAKSQSEESKVVTLADAIAPATPTLGDTLSTATPLAEEITNGKIKTLTDAIGINDKFLMIRDLFDGDSDAYAEAIATLDGFDSFDDCMIHIVENYAWNPDSEGAKFIMQLLERKLS
ncbi:MAG: hypothetical protein IKM69_02255 [Alistipes sp.]|nr:hypothetical protein [Alistipes sp.]